MSLFQSRYKKKIDKKEIPLLTIKQHLDIYDNVHIRPPKLETDAHASDFEPQAVALLNNNGLENKGIPIRCDHYLLALCIKGHADKRQNQHRFQITEYSAHFIQPGEIHSFSNTSSDFEIYLLLFDKSYLSKANPSSEMLDSLLYVGPDNRPDIHLDRKEFDQWKNLFHQLDQEMAGKADYYQQVVRSLIIHLLYLLKRKHSANIKRSRTSRQEQIYGEFRALIESHFQLKISVAEYAELLHISPKHLSETVKLVTNHPALHFIQERVVDESRYLLVYTSLNVKQIASKLNFDTPSHFVRFFKKHTGVTPMRFRIIRNNVINGIN